MSNTDAPESGLDVDLILESLGHTKRAFEETQYPTDELRRQQLDRVERAIAQVRAMRDSLRD